MLKEHYAGAHHLSRGSETTMHLKRVAIEGYRSIGEKVDVHVERDVTVLLGANDHGKTNILNAIRHLNSDRAFDPDTDLNWDRQESPEEFPCITFHFRLEYFERNALAELAEVPLSSATSSDPVDEAALHSTAVSEEASDLTGENPAQDEEAGNPESAGTLRDFYEIPQELIVEVKGQEAVRSYSAGKIPYSILEEFVESNEYLPRVEIVRPQEQIPDAVTFSELADESHEFMRGIMYYAGIDPSDAEDLFIQDDSTMKQLKKASVTLNKTLKAGWIQGKDLEFELSHGADSQEILLRIVDPTVDSRLVRASRRSSGFTHFFALKTILYARQQDYPANQYVFLFDEPGIYLHPSGQHDLLRVLDAIGKHNQVIYSTHSLFMINRTFPSRHRLIVKGANGTRIDGKPFVGRWGPAIEELGLSLAGTILFAQHVLLSEGDSDPVLVQAVFQKLVEWKKANVDLNTFSVISTENSKNTDALIRILSEGSNTPHLLVLVDGDQGGKERLKALKLLLKKYNVESSTLIEGTTIEDYLPASGTTYIDAVAGYVTEMLDTVGNGRLSGNSKDIRKELRASAASKGYSKDKVSAGIADWAITEAQNLAELKSKPSKLGIAREYVKLLSASTVANFSDSQLRRSLKLLQDVQSSLSIPDLSDPDLSVTIE